MKCWLLIWSLLIAVLAACEHGNYEDGDSQYSWLRADFVVVRSNADKALYQAVNDEGDTIHFDSPLSTSWALTPDTTYRALLYYQKKDQRVEVINVKHIPVVHFALVDTIGSDPLTFQSAWMSNNQRYLNIAFMVKTGKVNGEVIPQRMGVVCDSITESEDGENTLFLRLTHAQNQAPQYYSSQGYISIPAYPLPKGTHIVLRVNDYRGMIEKKFRVNP